jgi:hypothetical protein
VCCFAAASASRFRVLVMSTKFIRFEMNLDMCR